MNIIAERLETLRREMRAEHIDAMIFPSSDSHNSEYVAPHWESRKWISGFTGSAGTAVVTLTEAALWTDSRYFLQAEEQLKGTGYRLMKERISGTPTITDWLLQKMSVADGRTVAVDGTVMNYSEVAAMEKQLRKIGVSIRTNYDIMKMIWHNRPAMPSNEIYAVPEEYIGETVESKIQRIREVMKHHHCEGHIITDLMQIAWTLNLRGSDVAMTPVFLAYLFVNIEADRDGHDAYVFVGGPLTKEAQEVLRKAHIAVRPYNEFKLFLNNVSGRVLVNPDTTNSTVFGAVKAHAVEAPDPVEGFKAIKNDKEIEGFRRSMVRDGVAMVKWLRWLKPAVEAGGQTEISVSDKLEALRKESPAFRDLSFDTISGYNEHGAIVHYEATPETDIPLKPEGLLLCDSGAQYVDGTTDITRTIALGPVTAEMKRVYTYVLKANIALSTKIFPDGTNGTDVDAIARAEVWQGGYHYGHGTGHGVGWCLCVHEGPHCIRMEWRPAPLHPNMTVTNEPGIYLAGKFGVRTENTMLVVKAPSLSGEDWGEAPFIKLEPLTLCPIDTTPIDFSMLTAQELQWLNDYHQQVRDTLLPELTDEADKNWLIQATEKI